MDDWDNWGSQVSNPLGQTDLSFSPSVIGGSNLQYEPLEGLNIALQSKLVGKQYIDNSSSEERILPSYNVHDIQLMYRWNPGFIKEVVFSLMLNNVLNEKYLTNAWIYRYFYGGTEYSMDGFFPQAGFNFMTGLTLRF